MDYATGKEIEDIRDSIAALYSWEQESSNDGKPRLVQDESGTAIARDLVDIVTRLDMMLQGEKS